MRVRKTSDIETAQFDRTLMLLEDVEEKGRGSDFEDYRKD